MILLWIIAFGVISFPFDYECVGKYYLGDANYGVQRSEERRVGKECVP